MSSSRLPDRPIAAILATFLALALAPTAPPAARAEDPPVINERSRTYDYYAQDTDIETRRMLGLAEEYHLTNDTFWEQYRLRSWVRARGELVFILRIVPNHPQVLFLLEAVAKQMPDISYPIAYYERALRLYPQHAITRAEYGRFLVQAGRRDAGIVELRQALAQEPDLLQARGWLEDALAGRMIPQPDFLPGGESK